MSLAKKLVELPQREHAGSIAQQRFDYQAHWGLALIFSHHATGEDYAIAFEFHDDVLLLDSAQEPASVKFYQVKTKAKGHWTLGDLFRRNKGADGDSKLPSHIGRLFSDYLSFPDETSELAFVSNVPLAFGPSKNPVQFKECDGKKFQEFLKKLQEEHATATNEQAGLFTFVKADLSLEDAATHTKGKLNNFVAEHLGEVPFSLDSLYRAVIEECRTRSRFTGEISTFADLLKYKAITRADVQSWLDTVSSHVSIPRWEEVAAYLSVTGVEALKLRAEWNRYRARVLDAGDEALRTVRREIQSQVADTWNDDVDMHVFVEEIIYAVRDFARSHLAPLNDHALKVMVLYEVCLHGSI